MNVLIVGAGLSGICLGHRLEAQSIPFTIIDENENHSSKIAAGMINPMSFRRMIKSWRADEFSPVLKNFYTKIEQKIGYRFFYEMPIRRVFSTEHECKLWEERAQDLAYTEYVQPLNSHNPDYLIHTYGSGTVQSSAYVDAATFVVENQRYFSEMKRLKNERFNFKELDVLNKTYCNQPYTHLIFAEGSKGEENPYFKYLPFKNAKGEILTVKSSTIKEDEILNRKCFLLPIGNSSFKLGSTYVWNTKDPSPTEEGKQELLEKYNLLSNATIEIASHQGGIRPVSADRRPLIGAHPIHNGIYIFNGMGAKGFMLAPYFSEQFITVLMGQGKLDQEVDIQRFYKKHFKR